MSPSPKRATRSTPKKKKPAGASRAKDPLAPLKGVFDEVVRALEKQQSEVKSKLADLKLSKVDVDALLKTLSKNSDRAATEARRAVEKSKKILSEQTLGDWAQTIDRARGEVEKFVSSRVKKRK